MRRGRAPASATRLAPLRRPGSRARFVLVSGLIRKVWATPRPIAQLRKGASDAYCVPLRVVKLQCVLIPMPPAHCNCAAPVLSGFRVCRIRASKNVSFIDRCRWQNPAPWLYTSVSLLGSTRCGPSSAHDACTAERGGETGQQCRQWRAAGLGSAPKEAALHEGAALQRCVALLLGLDSLGWLPICHSQARSVIFQ